MPAASTDLPTADVYIDESSQSKHHFLVIGGIVLETSDVPTFVSEMRRVRLPELPSGEMKWAKISVAKLAAYKRVVDLFFDFNRTGSPHFHSLVVDTTLQDHKLYNQGSRELGFNKEIYQIAMKFGRLYKRHNFHVYLDYRSTSHKSEELRLILNRGTIKRGDIRDWPYRRVQFRNSKGTDLIQLSDVLVGAIALSITDTIRGRAHRQPKMNCANMFSSERETAGLPSIPQRTGNLRSGIVC
jgi:hypothetical protein